jgi:SAM-dependent methyltransferase
MERWQSEVIRKTYENYKFSEKEKKLLAKYINHGKVVVFGCGTIDFADYFASLGCDTTYAGYSKALVKCYKKQKHNVKIVNEVPFDFNFDDNKFDFVFSNELSFVYPDEKRLSAVNEVHRILKDGGMFLGGLSIPNWYMPFYRDKYEDFKLRTCGLVLKTYKSKISHKIRDFEERGFEFVELIYRFRHDTRPYFVFRKKSLGTK